MLKEEFKAARSANRLTLRNARRASFSAYSEAVDTQPVLMLNCKARSTFPESIKVWAFKVNRLGYTFNHTTNSYSK
jgi:hypothetical protein